MRLRRTVPTALLALAAALPAAGCGRERLDVPDVSRPAPVAGFTPVARPALGLSFSLPTGWTLAEGRAPLVARAGSGTATIAVWRYPRTEPLPDDAEALREARSRLVEAARTRDASFDLVRARSTRVDGARAISVVGDETVAGQRRRVRSTHVFSRGAEVVVDAYAARRDFAAVDGSAFRRVVRSLRLSRPSA
jgi:hypothetical protein